MLPSASYDDKARLYALADPAVIFTARDFIKGALYAALQVAPSATRRLTISESSGWFDYTDDDELWHRKAPPALPSQADAITLAESTLSRIEQGCSDANRSWPPALRGIAMLPAVNLLRRDSARAVARPDGSAWDHWLYRAEPRLQLDGSLLNRTGVYGAQVEVRIGHRGQVIGVRSRWRPLSGEKRLADLVPFRSQLDQPVAGPADPDEKPQPPITNYLLEGDGMPQHYLAPYYFQTNGHDITMQGATRWSLTVDIGRTRQDRSRMTLTALAQGGSGDYRYNWAAYSMADVTLGYVELGGGSGAVVNSADGPAVTSAVDLDNGHYIVMLNVKDRRTGAFKHHQQHVFSSAFTSDATGGAPALGVA